jgi:hypothetical protein
VPYHDVVQKDVVPHAVRKVAVRACCCIFLDVGKTPRGPDDFVEEYEIIRHAVATFLFKIAILFISD